MHLSDFRIAELDLPENAKEIKVKSITSDSRNSSEDCMFIAIKGNNQDGHNFIDEAISAGASNVLVDYKYKNDTKIPISKAKNVRRALALISAIYYNDQPNTIAAVTGTNGKTSVCSFLTQIWEKSNFSAASLGTLGLISATKFKSLKIKDGLTTLDPVNLHNCISHLKLNGINRLALEASSQGLDQHRLDGVNISLACFTNLSHDHLDYHKSFEDYKSQKFRLFKELLQDGGSAIINIDDKVGKELIKTIKDRNINIITYGKSKNADWKIDEILDIENYKTIKISAYGKSYIISTALNSSFHVENAVAAACLSFASGIPIENSLHSIKDLKPPAGRMQELISGKGTKIYIDFCHTPDALKNILNEKSSNKSRIFLVIGCGGNRDAKKRKIIGEIASKYTFKTFVTNDNPRDESPEKIRAEILRGKLKNKNNLTGIENRKKAIEIAIKEAQPEDIVIIAGKGHEKYQIFKDKKIPHNDFEFCKSLIQNEVNQ